MTQQIDYLELLQATLNKMRVTLERSFFTNQELLHLVETAIDYSFYLRDEKIEYVKDEELFSTLDRD